jgi:type II secretory pathway pseudopilin PulG
MKHFHVPDMRRGFSMLTAIFTIVIIASVSVLILNLSAKMVHDTTAQYQHEQAAQYARSYTEFAIMALTANDRNTTDCLENISATLGAPSTGNGYSVSVRIAFIANGSGKGDVSNCSTTRVFSSAVTTLSTSLSAIIDVYVSYKDPDNINNPYITYHTRTLQKI